MDGTELRERLYTGILLLPPETLIEVFSYLGWHDLLSLRLTCRTLSSITNSRSLWIAIVKQLQSRPSFSSMEEPMIDYTTEELESWARARLSADDVWDSPTLSPVRWHSLSFANAQGYISTAALITGGRWLLVLLSTGEAYYTDLNSPHSNLTLLLDCGGNLDDLGRVFSWSFLIDKSKPRLSFRLVISSYVFRLFNESPRTFFYGVTLVDHGLSATLSATFISTIQLERFNDILIVCQNWDDCVFVREDIDQDVQWLSIYPQPAWDSTESIVGEEMGMNAPGVFTAHLLPFRRIVVISSRFVDIYNYATKQHGNPSLTPPSSLSPTFRLALGTLSMSYTQPATLTSKFTRLTFLVNREITGISIPHNPSDTPTITKFCTIDGPYWETKHVIGYTRSIFIFDKYPGMRLAEHNWEESAQLSNQKWLENAISTPGYQLQGRYPKGMCEETGRIVLRYDSLTILVLYLSK